MGVVDEADAGPQPLDLRSHPQHPVIVAVNDVDLFSRYAVGQSTHRAIVPELQEPSRAPRAAARRPPTLLGRQPRPARGQQRDSMPGAHQRGHLALHALVVRKRIVEEDEDRSGPQISQRTTSNASAKSPPPVPRGDGQGAHERLVVIGAAALGAVLEKRLHLQGHVALFEPGKERRGHGDVVPGLLVAQRPRVLEGALGLVVYRVMVLVQVGRRRDEDEVGLEPPLQARRGPPGWLAGAPRNSARRSRRWISS